MLTIKIAVLLLVSSLSAGLPHDTQLHKQWEDFKTLYKKTYHPSEELKRRSIWAENLEKVRKHNMEADKGLHSFTLGINEYSDMTHDERKARMHGFKESDFQSLKFKHEVRADTKVHNLPEKIDWKTEGWVSPVGNQFQCGSCWAFTANGAVEGQHYNVTGQLVPLSAQDLMDCSNAEGNNGCEGGSMIQSYEYIIKNKGIDTDVSYPYTGKDEKCHFNKTNVGATLTGYGKVQKGSELALQKAVATIGPIAVAVDATTESFEMYKHGILNDQKCTQNVNHSLLVVGYGTLNGTDFWLMKNSWGTSWGNKGYIMMSRNKKNQCGVANMGSFPIAR
ncbi:cathepsin L1-like [Mizuhopecten yessoensis]|uniref:Cathepsin K n=1 Tax=Mizuhopecten yessoensis TaxID=6573 RepID=A0A210QXK3_MIZYE|nr:cathepsin L1-like [Mizuhopecten yessoensis]OWF53460.1 Cathepsin K [Mizuhopecten yessoensis]